MSIADLIDLNLSVKLNGVEAPGLSRKPWPQPGERPDYADAREVIGVPGLWLRPIRVQVDSVEIERSDRYGRAFGYVDGLERLADVFVLVHFRVPERDSGRELSLTYRKRISPGDQRPEYLSAMVEDALAEVMRHETAEMLYAGAARRRDPHPHNGQEPV